MSDSLAIIRTYAHTLTDAELASAWRILYEEHNRRVQDFFADRSDRLLVVDLREATWATFCVFLEYWSGCPSGDLPRENTYQAPTVKPPLHRSRRSRSKSPYMGPLGM